MSEGFIGKIMKMTDVLVPNKFTVSVRNFFRSCKRPALKNNGVSFSKMADKNSTVVVLVNFVENGSTSLKVFD